MKKLFRKFMALMRWNLRIVCEESQGMGDYDYHDYPDDIIGTPAHMVELECKRCGKKFYM